MTTALLAPAGRAATPGAVARATLPGAVHGRLAFAQVHEDPLLEIAALRATPTDRIVAVASGGCTALSLLAAGAGTVTAVDLNATQNHLVELKRAAVLRLASDARLSFLGAGPGTSRARLAAYAGLRDLLTPVARAWWDAHPALIGGGVLNVGTCERLMGRLAQAHRWLVHSRALVAQLLACRTLEEQRVLYHARWDNRRWRGLFQLLVGRSSLHRGYDAAFAEHAGSHPFAEQFRERIAYTLCELPVATNYFLHHLLAGRYPAGEPDGVPPYLSADGAARLAAAPAALKLVDGTVTDHLRRCDPESVDGFVLSNICEWLDAEAVDALFAEVARTARAGARVCFRNFVGWTEVPARWRPMVVEDREASAVLMRGERSLVQRRFVVCTVHPGGRA